ncbi:MAG: DNA-binding protein [Deltaproteobacteria bacterium]|nr:DNA-binding protein [Deltaproteobacteria bacterium]
MKKPSFFCLVAIGLLSLMLTVSASWAQSGRRLHYSTLFNPGTVGTVSGEVVRVEQAFSGSGQDYCVHARLKTLKGQVTAILAPKGYMEEQGLTIAPKDRVTVTGSLISVLGKPFLLAMEVQGDRTMKLREASGRPAWAVGDDWHIH